MQEVMSLTDAIAIAEGSNVPQANAADDLRKQFREFQVMNLLHTKQEDEVWNR